jgi:DNA-binding NarL/FixJ family response regulator
MSNPIKILLVEDQQLVREGLKGLLALHDEVQLIGEAADGAEAIDVFFDGNESSTYTLVEEEVLEEPTND